MMKNIKDITISIFAVIGFVAIITAFTNQPVRANQTTTPESHVWSFHLGSTTERSFAFAINKVTGEVRKYNSYYETITETKNAANQFSMYRVAEPQ